jgi:hypothetical protein
MKIFKYEIEILKLKYFINKYFINKYFINKYFFILIKNKKHYL